MRISKPFGIRNMDGYVGCQCCVSIWSGRALMVMRATLLLLRERAGSFLSLSGMSIWYLINSPVIVGEQRLPFISAQRMQMHSQRTWFVSCVRRNLNSQWADFKNRSRIMYLQRLTYYVALVSWLRNMYRCRLASRNFNIIMQYTFEHN